MIEENLENDNLEENAEDLPQDFGEDSEEENPQEEFDENILSVSGMYKEWFLDYASYVILERAVPGIVDGLKPVQRRILHAMKDLDDGRYNKVANIIGHTMKYHPHGDASIGDALVQLGQKDLLIDCQGNWGNTLTGDGAAAPRYIEARLSKFALDVVFNPKTTDWGLSYDGRNKEPIDLPVKFPLLLAQGAEGIAVGLACKMLPHNFNELIDASVAYLRGKGMRIYPDFLNGGQADFSLYNDGKRGGKVKVRARIKQVDKKTLCIYEVPYSTTSSLIDSIVKANDKGKIKIKKIEDNTAAKAEIILHLPAGISPDKTIDALYAFTDCEVSISPNACVIENDKPVFLGVSEMLKRSTDQTKEFLRMELQIRLDELLEQWHFASLERIFIENRIYRKIENEETWEGVIKAIDKGLKPHVKSLKRAVTEEDIVRLTEIKIKRISKFDIDKAKQNIERLEGLIKETKTNLKNLVQFTIDYFKELKKKYGKGRERKTEIKVFDSIAKTKVVVANKKLYLNRKEGFIGWSIKKDEYISECSDIDDIIVFRKDGKMMVTKIDTKKFVGKDVLHATVWKKGDQRTIYHMVYQDGTAGPSYVKRFNVNAITRDKEYDMTKGSKGSRVLFFSANPNGEAEIVNVKLRPRPKLKILRFDFDFTELAIKGRSAKGNILTKNLVSKIELREKGSSTLAARKVWFDDVVKRLNVDGRGKYLGSFAGGDKVLVVGTNGKYKLVEPDLALRFDEDMKIIQKWNPKAPVSVIYYDGYKNQFNIKRFIPELSSKDVLFITDHEKSYLELATSIEKPEVLIEFDKRSNDRPDESYDMTELISVKGVSAIGNRLSPYKIKNIVLQSKEAELNPDDDQQPESEQDILDDAQNVQGTEVPSSGKKWSKVSAKDGVKINQQSEKAVTVNLSVKGNDDDQGQGELF
ncbi:MAG: DNA gyrase/topoisomerase IV subunit A [Bacteroidota bacterium]